MRIGELARLSGVSARMLRHYDRIGLLTPTARTDGGYRDYDEDDIHRLMRVEALRSLGLPLHEVSRALDEPAGAPAELFDRLIARTSETIAREQELLQRLQQLRRQEPAAWSEVLRIIALMRGLDSEDASDRQRAALEDAGQSVPATVLAAAVLVESDPNVAGSLRWALAHSVDTDALALLVSGLDGADGAVRGRAIEAIVDIARRGMTDADPVLRTALAHPDDHVRARAALALGARGDAAATDELVAMIARGADDVAAAEALAHLARTHDAAAAIVALLAVRLRAASTPGGSGPDATAAGDHLHGEERLRLTQALGEIPGEQSRELLSALAADPQLRVRLSARYLLTLRETSSPSPE